MNSNIAYEMEGKIIGRSYPQVVGSNSEPLFKENQKRIEAEKFKTLPKENFSIKIAKSAKLTDTLSSFMATHSPIVSEKLAELLPKFNIPPFKLMPLDVYRVKQTFIGIRL